MRLVLGLALALAGTTALAAGGYHVAQRIPGPDGGWDFLRVDAPVGRLVMSRGTSVTSIDLATGQVADGLAPGKRVHDVLPVNGGAELMVTYGGTDTAAFVDAKTGAVVAQIATGKNPDAAAYDPKSGLALVMNHSGGDVTLVDPRAHRVVGTIQVGGDLEMAAVDEAGRAYVNVEDRNEIAVLDLKRRRVAARWALPGCDGPTGIAYDHERKWLVAACDGSTDVVDAQTGALVRNLRSGKEADGAAIDQGRRLAFVPGTEGSLTVISLAGLEPVVVQVVQTEPGTRTLAVDEQTGRVYLPVARLVSAPAGGRPAPAPGSFKVLVVEP